MQNRIDLGDLEAHAGVKQTNPTAVACQGERHIPWTTERERVAGIPIQYLRDLNLGHWILEYVSVGSWVKASHGSP